MRIRLGVPNGMTLVHVWEVGAKRPLCDATFEPPAAFSTTREVSVLDGQVCQNCAKALVRRTISDNNENTITVER